MSSLMAVALRDGIFGGPLLWADVSPEDNGHDHNDGGAAASRSFFEERDPASRSLRNVREAMLVVDVAAFLVGAGNGSGGGSKESDRKRKRKAAGGPVQHSPLSLAPKEVVVIAAYSAQVSLIRSLLLARANETPHNDNGGGGGSRQRLLRGVAVHTVDSFQGSEAPVVLLSLVRCNASGSVGFLRDGRRLNVAATRAKDLLVVVGSATTVIEAFRRRSSGAGEEQQQQQKEGPDRGQEPEQEGDGGECAEALLRDAAERGLVRSERDLRQAMLRGSGESSDSTASLSTEDAAADNPLAASIVARMQQRKHDRRERQKKQQWQWQQQQQQQHSPSSSSDDSDSDSDSEAASTSSSSEDHLSEAPAPAPAPVRELGRGRWGWGWSYADDGADAENFKVAGDAPAPAVDTPAVAPTELSGANESEEEKEDGAETGHRSAGLAHFQSAADWRGPRSGDPCF
jgi:hypothetical protein